MKKCECVSVPGELRKKIKKLVYFIGWELIAFGSSAAIGVSGLMNSLPNLAAFILCAIFLHAYTAWKELKAWKKQF